MSPYTRLDFSSKTVSTTIFCAYVCISGYVSMYMHLGYVWANMYESKGGSQASCSITLHLIPLSQDL